MSFVRKTYVLKFGRKRQTYVKVNGKTVLIEFTCTGGSPESKGKFTTASPSVIEGMEKDSGFGNLFVIESEEKTDDVEKESVQVRVDPLAVKKQRLIEEANEKRTESEIAALSKTEEIVFDPKAETNTEEVSEDVEDPNLEKEVVSDAEELPREENPNAVHVKNVQEAKDHLKSLFPELTARQLLNKELVLAVAKEKGIDFVFEN